ncbi:hypothetical protein AVEN_154242-1 [Araneus ventricosus]|uniref:Uncharacterized protein n=1 Tax=Araneus ventricosus TaxID=182803 RepID=A0A4Y2U518_ARAVE|nr:hypothetical protein AVEN_154242-1 [Araneus ventricosus]
MALFALTLTCDLETLINSICYLDKCIAGISLLYNNFFLLLGFFSRQWMKCSSLKYMHAVVSYSTCSSPQLDQVQESARPQKTVGERLIVKEESAASVDTDLGRPREEV